MKISVLISKDELKDLVIAELERKIGSSFDKTKIRIQTKSQQNYRSEWEEADFKATYDGEV